MADMDGTTVIVTGGARGMGAAEASLLVSRGATVLIADVLDDEGRQLATALGPRAVFVHVDVASASNWVHVVGACRELPPLRGLVNNAAVHWARPIEEESGEDILRMWSVNLLGPLLGIQAVTPVMRAHGGGSIINVSSVAGLSGVPNLAAYGTSKWGLRGLTKIAAAELGEAGIRVNSIHPGPIDTEMMRASPVASSLSFDRVPLRRAGDVDEVARLVAFLLSEESSFISGAEIAIDGGFTAGDPRHAP